MLERIDRAASGVTIRQTAAAMAATFVAGTAVLAFGQTNVELRDELVALRESDQSGRALLQEAAREHGVNSPEVRALWEEQSQVDARNMARLKEIVAEHGWPGPSLVGREASSTAFLILQHADHETQVEYLPVVKAAVEAGEFRRERFALFQDRILVGEDKPQIYGTQLYLDDTTGQFEPYPIEDEANVDARRQELGMMPLSEYIQLVRDGN